MIAFDRRTFKNWINEACHHFKLHPNNMFKNPGILKTMNRCKVCLKVHSGWTKICDITSENVKKANKLCFYTFWTSTSHISVRPLCDWCVTIHEHQVHEVMFEFDFCINFINFLHYSKKVPSGNILSGLDFFLNKKQEIRLHLIRSLYSRSLIIMQ